MKRVFRARLKVEKKWAYWNEFGELTTKTGKVRRLTLNDSYGRTRYYSHVLGIKHLIEFETVSEFTELHDKNGKRIFEGDILKRYIYNQPTEIIYVHFSHGSFCWAKKKEDEEYNLSFADSEMYYIDTEESCEVIGNEWDNPELLEKCLT